MTDTLTIKIVPEGTGSSAGTASTGVGVGGIGMVLGKLTAGIGVIAFLLEGLKPVLSILKSMFKLLSYTLRPMAELLINVLRPILILMRPFFITMNAMLAPVMDVVRQMGSIAAAQAAAGETKASMLTTSKMMSIAFGPIFVGMAATMLSAFITIVSTLLTTLLVLLTDLDLFIRNLFASKEEKAFNTELANSMKENYAKILDPTASVELVMGTAADWISGMTDNAREELAKLKETINIELPLAVDPFTSAPTDILLATNNTTTGLPATTKIFKDELMGVYQYTAEIMSQDRLFSIPSAFSSGLDAMKTATSDFTTNMESYATRIKSALSSAGTYNSKSKKLFAGIELLGVKYGITYEEDK